MPADTICRQSCRYARSWRRASSPSRPRRPARAAARLMLETGLRSLPVVEADGRLVGMLSRMNLLQVVVTSPLMSPQASTPTQPLRRTGTLAPQQEPISAYLHADATAVAEET